MRRLLFTFSAILVMALPNPAQDDWRLYGGSQSSQRFSTLTQINEQTVSRLGLVWSQELGTSRGLEATPIVADGMIYEIGRAHV